MPNVDIEVTLKNELESFGMPLYRPGDTVQGTVTLFPDEDITCEHLYARLMWHTEGRGTRYNETIAETDLFQGELRHGIPTTYDFRFTLPQQPWSYEGHYISVVWAIEIQIDVSWARDPKYAEYFILAPERKQLTDW